MIETALAPPPGEDLLPTLPGRARAVFREETLDPEDWPAFRDHAHQVLDAVLDLQQGIREQPAWRAVPEELEARFAEGPPALGIGAGGAWREVQELVLPYPTGNLHPRFWGWVGGTGTPGGVVAELIAAGMNSVAGNFDDAASRVEAQVIDWMKGVLGFPARASGVITSGGSVANLIGLAVARDARAGRDVRRYGVAGDGAGGNGAGGNGAAGDRVAGDSTGELVLYASTEVHASVIKAAQLLGLGRDALRLVPVDRDYRLRLRDLERAIARDRRRGKRPFAVVATAGTVNTGAIDDLPELARLTREEGLWLHVDGAFGALVALAPELSPLVAGLDRADSIAFDFHKWPSVPYEAGCVLVRDAAEHRKTFRVAASYLEAPPRGVAAQPDSTNDRGLQLSRAFKALKIWMHVKEHGLLKLGRMIQQNVDQARYLARLIVAAPDLELLAPVTLNVVCFRYAPPWLAQDDLDEVNREILFRLQEQGIATPSSTVLDRRFALRVANVNQRSRREDFEHLVREVRRLGREALAG